MNCGLCNNLAVYEKIERSGMLLLDSPDQGHVHNPYSDRSTYKCASGHLTTVTHEARCPVQGCQYFYPATVVTT